MKRFQVLLFSFIVFLAGCTPSDFVETGPSFDTLRIAFAEPLSSLSPLSYELANRRYLSQIYEPLLRFDGTFNIESALAVSWGRLDELTWDFRLREDVKFHTGAVFTAEDVVYSLEWARQTDSELAPLLATIESVTLTNEHRLTIRTRTPDPLLLNKLTYVYVFPQDTVDFSVPVGTGPYRLYSFSDDVLTLERFDSYWGALPFFPKVELQTIPDPDERTAHLLSEQVHVLAQVPPKNVAHLESEGMGVETFPSLELSFLMLNQNGVFSDPNLREAVWYAMSTDYAESLGGGFLKNASQYAATGIFGYRLDATPRVKDLEQAYHYRNTNLADVAVTFDIPFGLEALGEAIARDLEVVDIFVTVNSVLSPEDLQDKIQSGSSEMYFFGWKYDLADSADFFEAVVHSPKSSYGAFNGVNYNDTTLDTLIESAGAELAPQDRLFYLEDISELLLDDKSIIPLFESSTVFAFRPELLWNLRLDGQLWASEVIENVVE